MRACYVLLVAAIALFAGSEAATVMGQTQLSKLNSADSIRADNAVGGRLLRSHRVDDVEDSVDDTDDVDDASEEERGKPLFDNGRLEAALKSNSKMSRLFKRWSDNDLADTYVAGKIGVDPNGAFDQKFSSLFTGYKAYLRGWRPE